MEAGPPAAAAQPAQQPAGATDPPGSKTHPTLTWPQILSFAAFVIFVALAVVADPDADATVSTAELHEVGIFTMFLIGAMLPSDALIRFGRALYYRAGSTPQPGIAQLEKV